MSAVNGSLLTSERREGANHVVYGILAVCGAAGCHPGDTRLLAARQQAVVPIGGGRCVWCEREAAHPVLVLGSSGVLQAWRSRAARSCWS